MPGITLPNTGITLPELGADPGQWDDLLNACWEAFDEHDHTPGSGVLVPLAGININDDIDLAGFALLQAARLEMDEIALPSMGASFLFASSVNHELYWRTSGGVNLQITSGSGLNVSLIGGIAGDYASVGAELAYDDANDRYTFKQQGAPKPWARLASGDVRIHEFNTTESLYVALKAPSALAGNVDITLPLVLPAAQAFVQMSSAGVLSASNIMTTPVAFLDIATFEGAVQMDDDLNVDGEIGPAVFNGEVVLNANFNITLSGTGVVKTGDRTYTKAFTTPNELTGTGGAASFPGLGTSGVTLAAASTVRIGLDVKKHERLKSVTVVTAGASNIVAAIRILTTDALGAGTEATAASTTATGTARRTQTVTTPAVLADASNGTPRAWYIEIDAHASGSLIIAMSWVVDVP
jgi:hypothetical protein